MPNYEFECQSCKEIFIKYTSFNSPKEIECELCGEFCAIRLISGGSGILINGMKMKDSQGTPIWFPKDNKPYYDRALQKKFNTAKEKKSYLKEKKLVMDGSSDKPNRQRIPEAGDTRKYKTTYV